MINNYKEGQGRTFKVYAGDLTSDTISGLLVTPDHKGGDLYAKYVVPVTIE